MGISVDRTKNIKVEPDLQTKYFKDTISRQKKELKESHNKIASLEKELVVSRQELGQCQTDLKLSKQEILYKTKEISFFEQEIFLIKNPSLSKRVRKAIITISIGLLDLLAAILYSYAINKITGNPPDKSSEVLILLATITCITGLILQICST